MTKQKVSARTQFLIDWLDKNNARCLWEKKISPTVKVAGYMINGRIAIVSSYDGGFSGWDIFTSGNSNDTGATLCDAEQRLMIGSD